jgi:phosphatidate cytidylyltransferase
MELEQRPGRVTPTSRGEPAESLPTADQFSADRPEPHGPESGQTGVGQPGIDQPGIDQPEDGQTGDRRAAAGSPVPGGPAGESAATDPNGADCPALDSAGSDSAGSGSPGSDPTGSDPAAPGLHDPGHADRFDQPGRSDHPAPAPPADPAGSPDPAPLADPSADPPDSAANGPADGHSQSAEGPKGEAEGNIRRGAAPRARRGPGRNLPIAIGVGLALGAVVLLSVYLVKWVFVGVMVVFLGIAVRELSVALGSRRIRVPFVPVAAGGLAMLIVSYTSGPRGLLAAFSLTALLVLVWRLPGGARHYVQDTMAGLLAAVYVPFLASFVVLLLGAADGADRVITFMAVAVSSDIGGFFAGAFLGRHQLAPGISPKKTWEGLAGSAVACMAIGALLLPLLLDGRIWQGIVLGAAVVCSATLGDLIESMIKRDLGIKDMGRLLPEHGGVMDRIDSLLVTAPVVWLALQIFLPNG